MSNSIEAALNDILSVLTDQNKRITMLTQFNELNQDVFNCLDTVKQVELISPIEEDLLIFAEIQKLEPTTYTLIAELNATEIFRVDFAYTDEDESLFNYFIGEYFVNFDDVLTFSLTTPVPTETYVKINLISN